MGKSNISMVRLNSYVKLPEGIDQVVVGPCGFSNVVMEETYLDLSFHMEETDVLRCGKPADVFLIAPTKGQIFSVVVNNKLQTIQLTIPNLS